MAPRLPEMRSREDAQSAFLFRCAGDDELHAISLDSTARNIITRHCLTVWVLEGEIGVGVQDALPLALSPEHVSRGLRHAGFYVWKAPSDPHATTQ